MVRGIKFYFLRVRKKMFFFGPVDKWTDVKTPSSLCEHYAFPFRNAVQGFKTTVVNWTLANIKKKKKKKMKKKK